MLLALTIALAADFGNLWRIYLAAAAALTLLVLATVRDCRRNWVVFGPNTTTVCIDHVVTKIPNESVIRVTWIDDATCMAGAAAGFPTNDLTLDTISARFHVSLTIGFRSRKLRAQRLAETSYPNAEWRRHKGPFRAMWREWKAGYQGRR